MHSNLHDLPDLFRRRKGLLRCRNATHGLDVGQGRFDLGNPDLSLGNGGLHHVPPLLTVRIDVADVIGGNRDPFFRQGIDGFLVAGLGVLLESISFASLRSAVKGSGNGPSAWDSIPLLLGAGC